MKLIKRTAVIAALVFLLSAFSSCGYEISIRKKEETTAAPDSTAAAVNDVTQPSVTPSVPEITTGGADIIVDSSYQPVAMAAQDVLEFYTRAVNDVKLRAPGYIKTEYQDLSNVMAGSREFQLADRILNLVATELLKNSGDDNGQNGTIQVLAHDDIAVRNTFPLFGKDYGCLLENMNIIRSAVCYANDSSYKIVIQLDDCLNPEPDNSDFGLIMTPISRDKLSSPIEEYLVVLDMNQYQFDINYTGSEITCIIDKQSARMTNLTHKMVMDISINLNLDLIIFQTSGIKASGTLINHLEYSDFDWS